MPTLVFETTVPAPLDRVWGLHEDVASTLPALSPPDARVRVESPDLPVGVGSRMVIVARGPLGMPVRWVARIVEHRPPHAGGAGFVDVQESGPFKSWRHEHTFTAVHAATTRLTDRVTYVVPFGALGRLADRLFVRRQVERMFRYRHEALPRLLASAPPAAIKSST